MGFLKDLVIKLGLDSSGVDKGVKGAGNSLNNLKGMVGKVGAAMGIAFGVSELINFGKELISIGAKAEGVRAAFNRLNMPGLMNELKTATRGAVSEFDLMKTAVSASNFKIPLESLGTYLAFATRRAEETGQSVDYLVESIIMGIGRKSPMILDNLGISIVDIRNQMAKTGDMAKAVANIINEQMANAGKAADTAATNFGRLSATWENFKEALGSGLAEGTKNPVSFLTQALQALTNYVNAETIPTWRKLAGLVSINMLSANIQDANREANARLLAETQGKKLGLRIDVQDMGYDETLSKLKQLNKLITDPKQYTAGNIALINALQQRKAEFDKMYAAEIESIQAKQDADKAAAEESKKAAEAEAKKRAEIEASKKLAEENIRLNKASIADYETLIKLNDERFKLASSDAVRNQILKENGALKLQLELLNQSAIRYAEISGKKLKADPVTGITTLDRKTIDISGMNTDDLTDAAMSDAVTKYEEQVKRVDEIAKEFNSTIQSSMINAFSSIAETMGGISDLNMGQIVAKLLMPFADMAIAAGTIIMTTGTAVEALRTALTTFLGVGAIAAGGILIGVGVAAKAGLSALSAGGGGGGGKSASASGGSFVDTNSFYTRQNEIKVTGQLYGKGSDLYAVVETETSRRKRGF